MKTFRSFLLVSILCLLEGNAVNAQSYKWVTGGGSTVGLGSSLDEEQVKYMCTDSNKNIYMLSPMGHLNVNADTFHRGVIPGANPHVFLASYNCNGKIRWAKPMGAGFASTAYGLAYDGGANIYIAAGMDAGEQNIGEDTIVTSYNYNSALIKYDTGGHLKWVRFVGLDDYNTYLNSVGPAALAIDGAGNIHRYSTMKRGLNITPSIISTTGTYDLKYDPSGNLLTVTKMPIDSTECISRIVINPKTNSSYAIIFPSPSSSSSTYYLAGYSANDVELWTDTAGPLNDPKDIVYDNFGKIYCTGVGAGVFTLKNDTFLNSYGLSSDFSLIFILDTNGKIIKQPFIFNGSLLTGLQSITLLPNQKIAVTGGILGMTQYSSDSILSSAGEGQNPLFIIVDTAGKLLKLDQLHGGGSSYDGGMAITSDKDGNIYIGGEVQYSMTGTGLGSSYTNSGGNSDYFIMKYGYNCNCNISDEPSALFSNSSNHFTYTGSTPVDSVRWYFGDGSTATGMSVTHNYDTNGVYTVCVSSYYCDSSSYCKTIYGTDRAPSISPNGGVISVYPNPTTNSVQLTVNSEQLGGTYLITDISGRVMMKGKIISPFKGATKYVTEIDLSGLAAGMYFLTVEGANGYTETVKVVKE